MFKNKLDFKTLQIIKNIFYSSVLKGGSLLITLLLIPLYINYFNDNYILGIWFTIISVFSWIITFDVGVGNGLRNLLVKPLKLKDYDSINKLLSSSYFVNLLMAFIALMFILAISLLIDFVGIFDNGTVQITDENLNKAIIIICIGIIVQLTLKNVNSIYYAMQLSFGPALINFTGTLSVLGFLLLNQYLFNLSGIILIATIYSVGMNIPYVIASLHIFKFKLKHVKLHYNNVDIKTIKMVLSLGLKFFYLQILTLLIFNSNDLIISIILSPDKVVDYQVYNKYYSLFATLFSLALTPVWSAITEAIILKDVEWIKKLIKKLNFYLICTIPIYIFSIYIFPLIIEIWISNSILVNFPLSIIFVIYNILFVKMSIDSTIIAGFGKLNIQAIALSITLFLKAVILLIFVEYISSLFYLILINTLILLPYFLFSYYDIKRKISYIEEQSN